MEKEKPEVLRNFPVKYNWRYIYGWVVQTIFVLLFIVMLLLVYSYAENLKNDPCMMCSKKMGENVVCSTMGASRIYEPNGNVTDISTYAKPLNVDAVSNLKERLDNTTLNVIN